ILLEMYPCVRKARGLLESHVVHDYESFLSRAHQENDQNKRSLLVDMTGLSPIHNGTSDAMISITETMVTLGTGWQLSVVANDEAAKFHRLAERFPSRVLRPDDSRQRFTVAMRLNQPWKLHDLIMLHRWGFFNVITILDTISWDTIFAAPNGLDEAWRFAAENCDGIMYNSFFSKDRFNRRFPVSDAVPQYVCSHSFAPNDYVSCDLRDQNLDHGYILLIGNHFDHKFLAPTIEILAKSFPAERFMVLGCSDQRFKNVESVPSGFLEKSQVARMFARSKFIVFPSFYEGFGFPVLTGLSYGKTVFARESELIKEIASRYVGDGRLAVFNSQRDLVNKVGAALHDPDAVPSILRSASANGKTLLDWNFVAKGIIGFLDGIASLPEKSKWLQREFRIRPLTSLTTYVSERDAQISSLVQSWSWRMTAPLRSVTAFLRNSKKIKWFRKRTVA
ncbi:MAG: glycosyltransferase, partial [Desulfomonilaceae bacterium]